MVRQRDYIRRLFWLCYVLDKDISLRSGTFPLLSEYHCDLAMLWDFESTCSVSELICILSNDPRLSMIKEKTCRVLYSPAAFKVPDGELLLRIRELDNDLENWRLSVPAGMRPRLAIASDQHLLPPDMNDSQSVHHIELQLDYHYTLICIHTTVRRCGIGSEADTLPEDLHSVVHSSIDLSLEAARSTLLFLRAPISILGEGAFR